MIVIYDCKTFKVQANGDYLVVPSARFKNLKKYWSGRNDIPYGILAFCVKDASFKQRKEPHVTFQQDK